VPSLAEAAEVIAPAEGGPYHGPDASRKAANPWADRDEALGALLVGSAICIGWIEPTPLSHGAGP